MQLVFNVPSKDTPGYPRRLYTAAKFKESMSQGGFTPELVESLVDFLSAYVEGDNPKELLWDCTETQFTDLLKAVTGGGEATVPPQSGETSATP